MADPKNEEPTTASGPPIADVGSGNGGVSVNWRGIVDDDAPQPKTVRFLQFMKRSIVGVLVALGLKRKRLADGSLAPRPWVRVIVIWGGGLVLLVLFSAGHVVGAGNVGVPVVLGNAGEPLDSGLHFTAPWPITRVAQLSTRTQNYTMAATKGEGDKPNQDDSVTVLGRDGATAQVDATILYRVTKENATKVYENVGTDFTTAIIRPSAARVHPDRVHEPQPGRRLDRELARDLRRHRRLHAQEDQPAAASRSRTSSFVTCD